MGSCNWKGADWASKHHCLYSHKKLERCTVPIVPRYVKVVPVGSSNIRPTCMIITNSCFITQVDAKPTSHCFILDTCAAFTCVCALLYMWLIESLFTCYTTHDITAFHTWLRNQIIWIYHAAPGRTNNSAQSACQLCIYSTGESHSSLRWAWLPDLTLHFVPNGRHFCGVKHAWASWKSDVLFADKQDKPAV